MDKIPSVLSAKFPYGLGGCRSDGTHFECCEYDITIMDGQTGESIHKIGNDFVKIHHNSFSDTSSGVLYQLHNIQILQDDEWKFRMFKSAINEKQKQIALSSALDCIINSNIFATKARDAAKLNDLFSGVWIKCASFYLVDAILHLNQKRPSPTHILEIIRDLKKDEINQKSSTVLSILGIERASTSLLPRMLKSTMGFSNIVEKNGNSEIIQRKYDYLVQNSLLADCYFYLGYVNRNNVLKVKNQTHKNPEFIHILKVGLDIETDPIKIENQSIELLQNANEMLTDLKNAS